MASSRKPPRPHAFATLVLHAGEGAHADVEWAGVSGTIACARALAEIAADFCS